MARLDPDRLLAARVETQQHYTARDGILYALGLGIGADAAATDPAALRHLLEHDLVPVPTFATMLAYPGAWYANPDYGLDPTMMVNGAQSLTLHAELPTEALVTSLLEVDALTDKGPGRGALIHTRRTLWLEEAGSPLATIRQTYFCRGAGGFGGASTGPELAPTEMPDRAADATVLLPTRRDAALLFRLSGDWNLIHASPDVARTAGFERPILHGLATFGMVAHAVHEFLRGRLITVEARYSAPVLPGDRLNCEIWKTPEAAAFRVTNELTGQIALDHGRIVVTHEKQNQGTMP